MLKWLVKSGARLSRVVSHKLTLREARCFCPGQIHLASRTPLVAFWFIVTPDRKGSHLERYQSFLCSLVEQERDHGQHYCQRTERQATRKLSTPSHPRKRNERKVSRRSIKSSRTGATLWERSLSGVDLDFCSSHVSRDDGHPQLFSDFFPFFKMPEFEVLYEKIGPISMGRVVRCCGLVWRRFDGAALGVTAVVGVKCPFHFNSLNRYRFPRSTLGIVLFLKLIRINTAVVLYKRAESRSKT